MEAGHIAADAVGLIVAHRAADAEVQKHKGAIRRHRKALQAASARRKEVAVRCAELGIQYIEMAAPE